jgi:hypothetical protein
VAGPLDRRAREWSAEGNLYSALHPPLLIEGVGLNHPFLSAGCPCVCIQGLEALLQDRLQRLKDGMLPDTHHAPSESFEGLGLALVPGDVGRELVGPEIVPCSWSNVVFGAAMPETAVNEDGDLSAGEDDVGSSCGGLVMEAIASISTPQGLSENVFRSGVLGAYARHHLGASERHDASSRQDSCS